MTQPHTRPPLIVAHVVNDTGAWGAGVSGAITARWPSVEHCYRAWSRRSFRVAGLGQGIELARRGVPFATGPFDLAELQICPPIGTRGIYVANLLAQQGVRLSPDSPRALVYTSLVVCLGYLRDVAAGLGAAVHIPFGMGAGLAGGDWGQVLLGAGCWVLGAGPGRGARSRRCHGDAREAPPRAGARGRAVRLGRVGACVPSVSRQAGSV